LGTDQVLHCYKETNVAIFLVLNNNSCTLAELHCRLLEPFTVGESTMLEIIHQLRATKVEMGKYAGSKEKEVSGECHIVLTCTTDELSMAISIGHIDPNCFEATAWF
jgi:hypothetical protein